MKKLKINKKLMLKKYTLVSLDKQQIKNIKGGAEFLSIGHACSHENDCSRLHETGSHVTYHHCKPAP